MPELAEVETWRRLVRSTVIGKTITAVTTANDSLVMDVASPTQIRSFLYGKTIDDCHRKGKHLWMTFDGPGHLYVHFGMSGSFQYYTSLQDAPSHEKLVLQFADGSFLSYRNPRRIGRLRIFPDASQCESVARLGPDPYLDSLDADEFMVRFHNKKQPVKSMLLDQRYFAGVGNWIADEVLYQAKLNPFTPCCDLSRDEIQLLIDRLQDIITLAIDVAADDTRFPKTWLFHYRWGKKATSTFQGENIQFDTIGGRTCAWVPSCQNPG